MLPIRATQFADDEAIAKQRKAVEEGAGKADGEIADAVKLVKVYAESSVFGAIDENGKLYMWGNNWAGQCDVPENLPPIVEIGIGHSHAVALDIILNSGIK